MLERPGDVAAILTNLERGDVLFIDEIHRLNRVVEEVLYPAMEDFQLDIIVGQGPSARTLKLELKPFTLVGATTRTGLLTSPLRDRFGAHFRLDFYDRRRPRPDPPALGGDPEGAARRRGRRRDRAALARHAADRQPAAAPRPRLRPGPGGRHASPSPWRPMRWRFSRSTTRGFDKMDRAILLAIIEKFGGGPVGLDTLAAAVGEERDTIEDVYEPYLIKEGFLARTPKGRVVTEHAFAHFGLPAGRLATGASPVKRVSAWKSRVHAYGQLCERPLQSYAFCGSASSWTGLGKLLIVSGMVLVLAGSWSSWSQAGCPGSDACPATS